MGWEPEDEEPEDFVIAKLLQGIELTETERAILGLKQKEQP